MQSPSAKPLTQSGPRAAPEAGQRARVLIVDDDKRNLLALRTILEDVSDVVVADSGEEALRHLLKGEFAVILLDVFMPGMDGYETAQIIRSREQTKRIPIVFLSAVNKEAEHMLRGYSMGAVDYVFKPVDAVVLRSKVAVFVDLFAKTKEIERKASHEQALLDAALRANAERLKAEQGLHEAEQRQAAIIQSIPILLYLEPVACDPRCPTFVSGDLQAMTGYTFADVVEHPELWAERLHKEDRSRVLAALRDRDQTGRLSVEYRWRCADGTYKHFHDQAVLLKDGDGRPTEYAGTLTDVTDRRLLETQLVQAQKMDAIGKLTGGIAHDFNNLLAAVLGGLGLIERRAELSDDHKNILSMTKRAAEQGSELVRRLLAFSRQQQLEPAPLHLESLHKSVDELLKHTLGGLVELHWLIPRDAWRPFADQSQLELALMNLIINARDAMPHGGTISVSAENRSVSDDPLPLADGDYICIAVEDRGCGIPADVIDKVLEPFFTTKDVGKGTGLGLSMVYGFAKQSGGTLRLTSEVGSGTRAELWLPRASDNHSSESAPIAAEEEPEDHRPLRILLIDDHAEVRGTTAAMLADLGHSISEAASGPEAIEIMQSDGDGFDLLITDYAMPRQSGAEVVRIAREQQPDLPAIIVTGYADEAEIGNRPSKVRLLMKPFTLGNLSQAVRRAGNEVADG